MTVDLPDWTRRAGQGRYAKPERERRFLVTRDPPAGEAVSTIADRYIEGTRLRLRQVTDGATYVYKLTQKVRPTEHDPSEVFLTNIYLSYDEYVVVSQLPGQCVTKTRRVCRYGEHDFAVDDFLGPLRGLRLVEVEVDDLRHDLPLPPWLGQEVTHDERYSGGFLAAANADEIKRLIRIG